MQLYDFIQPPKELLKPVQVAKHLYDERWAELQFEGEEPPIQYRVVYKPEHERQFFSCSLDDLFGTELVYDRRYSKESEFESRFECGNLMMARRGNQPNQYLLRLQDDTNTTGYCLWFFFRFCNQKKHDQVQFDIVNFRKNYSLFGRGMKPCVYSRRRYEHEGVGWHRSGSSVDYFRNGMNEGGRQLHSLHFEYRCEYEKDEIYFSYCYPYLYSDAHKLLRAIETRITERQADRGFSGGSVTTLGKTIAGNDVEAISIGTRGKPLLLLMARVHPSETVSSYLMEGAIRTLFSEQPQARFLLQHCRVVLIPMLNPDGVVHGNSRSSYAGCDLNRRWLKPTKQLQPEIMVVRRYIHKLVEQCEKTLVSIDLHGHSGKENLFFYGCQGSAGIYEVRQFPMIMCKLSEAFSYSSCCYYIQENRMATARVALSKEFRGMSYTLQTSVMGPSFNHTHFQRKDYLEMGKLLIKGLAIYRSLTVTSDLLLSLPNFSAKFTKRALMNEIKETALQQQQEEEPEADDSSDSEKSSCNLPQKTVVASIMKAVCRTTGAFRMRQLSVRVDRPAFHSRLRKRTDLNSARKSQTIQKRRQSTQEQYLFNFKVRRQPKLRPL